MPLITNPIEALKEILDLADCGICLTNYGETAGFVELSDEEIIENSRHLFEQIEDFCHKVIFSNSL